MGANKQRTRENDRVKNSVRFGDRADRDRRFDDYMRCGDAHPSDEFGAEGDRLPTANRFADLRPFAPQISGRWGRLSTWIMPGHDAVPGLCPEVRS